jgi:tetrapyrrole methylase family protein/MazG family protein
MVNFLMKDNYDFYDLVKLTKVLRSENGCPWDREQTHKSIRMNFVEEVYEACEAIDNEDTALLLEELGDVLLQVVFHAQMEKEKQSFDFSDVCDGICKKLVERHPHVFGSVNVENTDEVLKNWDDIKRQTKKQRSQSEAMAAIPATYPALMKAQKVQEKAKKAGFDWRDSQGAFDKIAEESKELQEVLATGDKEKIEDELGDLFFSVVNTARFCGCDAETALEKATQKFMKRFTVTEKLASEKGIDMKEASIEVLDELWDEAKKQN